MLSAQAWYDDYEKLENTAMVNQVDSDANCPWKFDKSHDQFYSQLRKTRHL